MDKDLRDILSALNARHARYVVVGGYAVGVHAQPRVTKDLDIFIASNRENAESVYQALADFGAPLSDISPADFERQDSIVRIGVPPICIDILQHMDGCDFETVWAESELWPIDEQLSARYISAAHLVKNKLASGRPQDLADVEAIRNAQKVRDNRGA